MQTRPVMYKSAAEWLTAALNDKKIAEALLLNPEQQKEFKEYVYHECHETQIIAEQGGYEPSRQASANPIAVFNGYISSIITKHPDIARTQDVKQTQPHMAQTILPQQQNTSAAEILKSKQLKRSLEDKIYYWQIAQNIMQGIIASGEFVVASLAIVGIAAALPVVLALGVGAIAVPTFLTILFGFLGTFAGIWAIAGLAWLGDKIAARTIQNNIDEKVELVKYLTESTDNTKPQALDLEKNNNAQPPAKAQNDGATPKPQMKRSSNSLPNLSELRAGLHYQSKLPVNAEAPAIQPNKSLKN